jgi:DNA-binding response OmpR family regulator
MPFAPCQQSGRADHLIRYAWAEADDVDPAGVTVVISRLRRKMQQHGFTSQIEIVNQFDYRLGLSETWYACVPHALPSS